MSNARAIEAEIRALAESVTAGEGLEVYDLVYKRFGPRWKIQLFLSRPDGERVGLEDCERVSRQLSRELDVHDPVPHGYDLEVSSPGLDRTLREPWHWKRALGEDVRVRWRDEEGRTHTCVAKLEQVLDEGRVVLAPGEDDESKNPLTIALDDVLSARVHFTW